MSNNSLNEVLKAFDLLDPIKQLELEFRLHYDETGNIYLCTMQNHPKNTKYIVVTREEYDNYFKYRVVDTQLKKIELQTTYSARLKLSNLGHPAVKGHAALLIEQTDTYSNIEYYDYKNN